MIFLTAFLLGVISGAGTVMIIRVKNTMRKKKYGFSERPADILGPSCNSDKTVQYPAVTESVDGSKAVKEFKS